MSANTIPDEVEQFSKLCKQYIGMLAINPEIERTFYTGRFQTKLTLLIEDSTRRFNFNRVSDAWSSVSDRYPEVFLRLQRLYSQRPSANFLDSSLAQVEAEIIPAPTSTAMIADATPLSVVTEAVAVVVPNISLYPLSNQAGDCTNSSSSALNPLSHNT